MQGKYLNRELSWLEFNARVVDEAANPSIPKMERVRFLAISANNLDEFLQVRFPEVDSSILPAIIHKTKDLIQRQEALINELVNVASFETSPIEIKNTYTHSDRDCIYLAVDKKGKVIEIEPKPAWHYSKGAFEPIESTYKAVAKLMYQHDMEASYLSRPLVAIKTNSPASFGGFGVAVFGTKYPISMGALFEVASHKTNHDEQLHYPAFEPRYPERLSDFAGDYFAAIKHKDMIIHHPYETFDVVQDFVAKAAKDPRVLEIKQTIYRTKKTSGIVAALIEAIKNGKKVDVLIELRARFDEENNQEIGRMLKDAGVNVIMRNSSYKTHAKITLVKRDDGDFAHFGTGNYHPDTAKIYSDLSFFTANKELCDDARKLFESLDSDGSGVYGKLIIAPHSLRKFLEEKIAAEIAFAKQGRPANILIKVNSLIDEAIIDKLYEAANSGVKITLIVRGMCSIIPQQNIEVKSIIGRFLEHSRIFCFGSGFPFPSSQNTLYISSADIMTRNLDKRIEVVIPIENHTVHEQVLGQILQANLDDNKQSWLLDESGRYNRIEGGSFSAHDFFISNPSLSGRGRAVHGDSVANHDIVSSQSLAVIDIGSNSIRLVIYDELKRTPLTLINEKTQVGLAKELSQTGKLSQDGVEAAYYAISRYMRLLDASAIKNIHAFATSATRDAKDGKDFMLELKRRFNLDVRVLSGEEEAYYSALGVVSSGVTTGIVADLGGGSLEFSEIKDSKIGNMNSLPIGYLRGRVDELAKHLISISLNKLLEGKSFYPIGGNFRSIAKLHIKRVDYPLNIVQGYLVRPSDMLKTLDKIIENPKALVRYNLNASRIATLPYTAHLLKEIIRIGCPKAICFSNASVREGLIYEMLPESVKSIDPLIAASTDMLRHITPNAIAPNRNNYWLHFSYDLSHLLTRVFTDIEPRFLKAASILSHIAWYEASSYKADAAFRLILDSDVASVSHKERLFLAASVFFRYHKGGVDETYTKIQNLLGEKSYNKALALGLSMRLMHKLTAGARGILPRTSIINLGKTIEIRLHHSDKGLITEESKIIAEELSSKLQKTVVIT
jgi:polyphosphate kinase/exopolyphosphatase/pppGpp-phosphohydrolase